MLGTIDTFYGDAKLMVNFTQFVWHRFEIIHFAEIIIEWFYAMRNQLDVIIALIYFDLIEFFNAYL